MHALEVLIDCFAIPLVAENTRLVLNLVYPVLIIYFLLIFMLMVYVAAGNAGIAA